MLVQWTGDQLFNNKQSRRCKAAAGRGGEGGRDWQLVYEMLIDSRAIVLATERGSGFPKHPSLGDTSDGKQDRLSTWALQLCLHRAGKYQNLTRDGSAKYIGLFKKGDLIENRYG